MEVAYNGANRLLISFFIFEKKGGKQGGHSKNSSNFEQRGRKYAKTWGSGGRVCGRSSLHKTFFCTVFVFVAICFRSTVNLGVSKVATEL